MTGTPRRNVVAVVPALNEAETIRAVVTDLRNQPHLSAVIVVDNGSSDCTAAEARAAGATVESEPRRGYGAACATGVDAARSIGADVIVFLDADGSSLPSEIDRVVGPLIAGTADLVLGSRVLGTIESGAMPTHQRLGNRWCARLLGRLFDLDVTDLGPYRAIDARLLDRLEMSEMTYGWPTEMTARAARSSARVIEVPTTWAARQAGRSKVGGTVRGSILAGWSIVSVAVANRSWHPPGEPRPAT